MHIYIYVCMIFKNDMPLIVVPSPPWSWLPYSARSCASPAATVAAPRTFRPLPQPGRPGICSSGHGSEISMGMRNT